MLKKHFLKSMSLLTLTGILTLTTSNFVFAKGINNSVSSPNLVTTKSSIDLSHLTISPKAISFTKKMIDSGLIKEFEFNKNGKLVLKDSINNIKVKYSLDDSSVHELKALLAFAQKRNSVNVSPESKNQVISPNVYVSNWKVYFSNDDINAFLFASAQIGPAALAAALDGVATLMGGPVGTTIGVVLDVLGASALSRLCYLIIQAEANDQGIYIGISWNGGFPNYTDGTY